MNDDSKVIKLQTGYKPDPMPTLDDYRSLQLQVAVLADEIEQLSKHIHQLTRAIKQRGK